MWKLIILLVVVKLIILLIILLVVIKYNMLVLDNVRFTPQRF